MLTLPYDSSTFLPRLTLFQKGTGQKVLKAMAGTVTQETNQNLTPLRKLWLQWHFKIGHLGFEHVRWLGINGALGPQAQKIRQDDPSVPKCGACQLGKQHRRPTGAKKVTRDPSTVGALKKDKLVPGQLVFMDQLESQARGCRMHTKGHERQIDKFCGSTVFCDAASHFISVQHQVNLMAAETLKAKAMFERQSQEYGVKVEAYHSDNGIFTARDFVGKLMEDGQRIRYSGVGAKHQNGQVENAIKIVATKARTLMIHASLHWPEAYDDSLWPMAVSYAADLYNHMPSMESGLSPAEIYSGAKSNHSLLKNAHPWGCPVYVLEPKLQDGAKIPKWQPRSKQGQFLGFSPVHAETVGLIKNLRTGYISPQFHVVYDDWFETVTSTEAEEPKNWEEMLIYQCFQCEFEPHVEPPPLSDDWLTDEEVQQHRSSARQPPREGRVTYQESHNVDSVQDREFQAKPRPVAPDSPTFPEIPMFEPTVASQSPREQPKSIVDSQSAREQPGGSSPREQSSLPEPKSPVKPKSTVKPKGGTYWKPAAPRRARNPVDRFDPTKYQGIGKKASYATAVAFALLSSSHQVPQFTHAPFTYLTALGTDPVSGCIDGLHPGIMQYPMALKAKKSKDPDLPTIREALCSPYSAEFRKAMDVEIETLEKMDTWEVIPRSELPAGSRVIPGTWAFRIKRRPDGSLKKFKARFCCQGQRMIQGVDFQDSYSPVVGWPTVRSVLVMAASLGWESRQVDFISAFCQAEQKEPLYLELPQHYKVAGREHEDLVSSLKKSLYGTKTAPKMFYEFLKEGLESLDFVPSKSDPCLFIHKHKKLMALSYVDDCIFTAEKSQDILDTVQALKDKDYLLELEEGTDMFEFLGIDIKKGETIEFTQKGLTDKVLKYTGMSDATPKDTPAALEALGSDPQGDPFDEEWSYAAAIGMLLYLSSNSRPDIQFAVHQAARFTHAPKKSHG